MVLASMVMFGIALGLLGAVTAWRERNAVSLLVVGFGAVLIGLFGERITELVLKIGDNELQVRQQVREELAPEIGRVRHRVDELAKAPDTPDALRTSLEEIGQDVERVQDAPLRPVRRGDYYHARHLLGPGGEVLLELTGPSLQLMLPAKIRCSVITPAGGTAAAERSTQDAGISTSALQPMLVKLRWPDDFADVSVPGKYHVEWARQDPLSSMSFLERWETIAIDSFALG